MHLFPRQIAFSLIAIFIATAAGANCFASCGDWLAEPDGSMEQHVSTDEKVESSAENSSESVMTRNESEKETGGRCLGPECRQSPAAPLLPLARNFIIPVNDAQSGTTIFKVAAGHQNSTGWELLNEDAIPGHQFTLERPPQFAK